MTRRGKHERQEEHYTKMIRSTMETPAWRALSTTAQALYPWLKLEWHGPGNNNNGKIRLSLRQAAERLGVVEETAGKAFHDLQAKGFIVLTRMAHLGVEGMGKSSEFELTELKMPNSEKPDGRKLYRNWRPGNDFPVIKMPARNPFGRGGKTKNPSKKIRRVV
ncbi:hypothetical protein HMH01_08135 [Halovulum dunhuangense]|uniref:Uncharacterized protein n=1 Tax=Halovulum dunhuangense TaxID=1505036 RepID=A0A849L253_9RHOB|nr:hypothetical protein [Halovulum dunhuangense]